ncbi:MAG: IS3 family transposase [Candidatus Marsarchaeota archaeon]|nr:IS3 family transposase [Candidatus Marsarchaeota archaeon]
MGSARPRVVAPDPEVSAVSGRRRFSASYKARIVREADACVEVGEVGALLRREGLYSSNLTHWRKQYRNAGEAALADDKRGRKVTTNPLSSEVERLGRELERTQKKLTQAEMIIGVPKKLVRDSRDIPGEGLDRRGEIMEATKRLASVTNWTKASLALGVARASVYRFFRGKDKVSTPREPVKPERALSDDERQHVLDTLNSERFVDMAPMEVYATLLDEGVYLCSTSTMYRILKENNELRERRNQARHANYEKPELLATRPNELWSWDITKLKGPAKWTYYYLYVILDVFSRYVVGWMVAPRESAELASRLISETIRKQEVDPSMLTIHADRGSSMKSKCVAMLLSDLGVTKTHSRPHVSNDNPFSESQFKTMKYRPEFPANFGCIEDARGLSGGFFDWYNQEHHHSGIALLTPEMVHYGLAEQVRLNRNVTLERAYQQHPERFVRKVPESPRLPEAVWINPPAPPSKTLELLNN